MGYKEASYEQKTVVVILNKFLLLLPSIGPTDLKGCHSPRS